MVESEKEQTIDFFSTRLTVSSLTLKQKPEFLLNTGLPVGGSDGCSPHLYVLQTGIILKPLRCSAVMKYRSAISFITPP